MPDATAPSFGDLLRSYRRAAGLSQEALAEAAGVSRRAVSDLERGPRRAPYPDTLRRLTEALRLDDADRARLGAALTEPNRRPVPRPLMLPADVSRFVGRERELAALGSLLPTTRLLTLTGAGGCGKSRLALALARRAADDYPDGVRLVELAALADPALVPQAVALALGAPEQPGRPVAEALVAWLAGKRLLLMLDNCEHLLDACADLVEALLRACPDLRVLATSRERLRLAGEVAWRVPSLALPPVGGGDRAGGAALALGRLAAFDAVRLFVQRAGEAEPGFRLGSDNAAAVARICAGLDGIPLALELAAARLPALTVEQLAARLDDGFRLLTAGSRAAPPRQRTLRATIDWSHALLTESEQILLRRLAVFAGGCTLEAAEAVCAGDGIDAGEVLDLLTRLVEQSLAQVEGRPEGARYRLLETIRQYGWEHLRAAGEEDAVRRRHLDWCLALAEQPGPIPSWRGDHVGWLTRIDREHDNLRAALAWRLGADRWGGLRLAGSLWQYWRVRGAYSEGSRWLADVLRLTGDPPAEWAEWRARALIGAGLLAREQGDLVAARRHFDECLALSRAVGSRFYTAWALRDLGVLRQYIGDVREARRYLEEGLALSRQVADRHGEGVCLMELAVIAEIEGEYPRARALGEASLAIGRARDSPLLVGNALAVLVAVALFEGDGARAEALLDEGLRLVRAAAAPRYVARFQMELGRLAQRRGDAARAAALYEASLAWARAAGARLLTALDLAGLGELALRRGEATAATALLEESLALFADLGHARGQGQALLALGLAAWRRRDPDQAFARLRRGLALRRRLGERLGVAECLEGLATVAAGTGAPGRAARLLGAAGALREAIGAPLPPVDRPGIEAMTAAVRAALGDASFAAAWAAGQRLSATEAVAEALESPTSE
jgi:predicted ATPase/DNA-binding XRE family transcriptional regulator